MVEVSRRTALGAGVATLGFAIVGSIGAPVAADAAPAAAPLRSAFEAAVGRDFVALRGRTAHKLRLFAVRDLHPTTARQRPHCFNLIFLPVHGQAPTEGIYRVQRAGLPASDLFLSPVGGDAHVQALVNRAG
jgi:hypothetical protein